MPPDLISPGRSAIFLKVRILRDGCALTDSGQRAGGQAEARGNRLPQKKDRTVDISLYVCAALLAAFPIRMLPRIRSPKTYQILLEKQMRPIRGFATPQKEPVAKGRCASGGKKKGYQAHVMHRARGKRLALLPVRRALRQPAQKERRAKELEGKRHARYIVCRTAFAGLGAPTHCFAVAQPEFVSVCACGMEFSGHGSGMGMAARRKRGTGKCDGSALNLKRLMRHNAGRTAWLAL